MFYLIQEVQLRCLSCNETRTWVICRRKIAPLSKALVDIVISHSFCGSNVNPKGETFDAELEKENFKAAGNILCQMWVKLVLDGKPNTIKMN